MRTKRWRTSAAVYNPVKAGARNNRSLMTHLPRHEEQRASACTCCGYPVGSAAVFDREQGGTLRFRHVICPSLSERRRFRAEALAKDFA